MVGTQMFHPQYRKGPPSLNLDAIYRSGFKCKKCNKSSSSKDVFLDLSVTAGLRNYTEVKLVRTELFRIPLVSFLYERGWHQNFNLSGFPAADEEVNLLQVIISTSLILKVEAVIANTSRGLYFFSCQELIDTSSEFAAILLLSGLMFPGYHSRPVLLMLYMLVLPCIAGHLLPMCQHLSELKKPSYMATCFYYLQIAEISRILRSVGVFVGSTFLRYTSSTPWIIRPFRERVMQSYSYLTEEEIGVVCTNSGLTNFWKKLRLNPNTDSTAVSNLTATISNPTAIAKKRGVRIVYVKDLEEIKEMHSQCTHYSANFEDIYQHSADSDGSVHSTSLLERKHNIDEEAEEEGPQPKQMQEAHSPLPTDQGKAHCPQRKDLKNPIEFDLSSL
ncbi:hypothetical protein J1N35_023933 [Gossypium stocksii]|uniref:Uncharacterized protein n=1 Tax=Gossypium stocksii TaxID=47602 RepID=A0A9D4A460_9ROSI|nr:hypothetical protein J1N35_023933 [Gossypium stocksii]